MLRQDLALMVTDTAVSKCGQSSLEVIVKTNFVIFHSVEIKQIQNWSNESAAGNYKDYIKQCCHNNVTYVYICNIW